MTRRHRAIWSIVGAALITLAIPVGYGHDVLKGISRTPPAKARPISYRSGRQILFVYIGSEDCSFSLQPGFDKTVRGIQALVWQQAKARGLSFSSLGVSAGQSSDRGFNYLSRFGPFDEVISGRGFLNTAAMRYFFEELPGEASFPQILVIQRDLFALQPGYTFRNEKILVRAIGLPQIEAWADDLAPIS